MKMLLMPCISLAAFFIVQAASLTSVEKDEITPNAKVIFAKVDKDGNGKTTREELAEQKPDVDINIRVEGKSPKICKFDSSNLE